MPGGAVTCTNCPLASTYDPDNGPISPDEISYQWYVNSIPQGSASTTYSDFTCSSCVNGDSVTLGAKAYDGTDYSTTESISGPLVVNPPPNQPPNDPGTPAIAPVNALALTPNGAATCTNCPIASTTDPDGNYPVAIEYAWFRNNVLDTLWSGTASDYPCSGKCNADDTVSLHVRAKDSGLPVKYSNEVASDQLTVSSVPTTALPVCGTGQFNSIMALSGMGLLGVAALVALAYMFGEMLQNPKAILWAKTESLQVFASLAIVLVMLFAIFTFCNVRVGEIGALAGTSFTPAIYLNHATDDLYTGAVNYLENLQSIALVNIASLRYNLAAYEIRTSFNEFHCDSTCLLSFSSVNVAVFGGETVNLAITNNLLGTATISALSIIFQYFTLLYILNGLFIIFLPLAIVIRSIPFMRQFGGALIAIFISLYFLYPAMLVADAFVAPGLTKAVGPVGLVDRTVACTGECTPGQVCRGSAVFSISGGGISCAQTSNTESSIESLVGTSRSDMENLAPSPLVDTIKVNVLIFLAAVFLPALNFVVIAALARDLSHFLGEEADISRLAQMV